MAEDVVPFAMLAELEKLGTLSLTGLSLPQEGVSFDQLIAMFRWAGQLHEAASWVIGDLINYTEKVYGETYAQAADATGLSEQTLQNYASICGRIPRSRRRKGLKFSIHAEVAYLTAKEQEHWLKQAGANNWRRRELREALAPLRAQKALEAGRPVIVTSSYEILPPAVESSGVDVFSRSDGNSTSAPQSANHVELGEHLCQCLKCGMIHRDDTDVVPA